MFSVFSFVKMSLLSPCLDGAVWQGYYVRQGYSVVTLRPGDPTKLLQADHVETLVTRLLLYSFLAFSFSIVLNIVPGPPTTAVSPSRDVVFPDLHRKGRLLNMVMLTLGA